MAKFVVQQYGRTGGPEFTDYRLAQIECARQANEMLVRARTFAGQAYKRHDSAGFIITLGRDRNSSLWNAVWVMPQ